MSISSGFSKRGSMLDFVFLAVMFIVIAVVFVLVGGLIQTINTQLQLPGTNFTGESKAAAQATSDRMPALIDGAFLTFLIGAWIAILVFAYLVDTSPAFSVFAVILLIVVGLISAYLANVYDGLTSTSLLYDFSSQLVMIPFILSNWLLFVGAMAGSMMLVLYFKVSRGGSGA